MCGVELKEHLPNRLHVGLRQAWSTNPCERVKSLDVTAARRNYRIARSLRQLEVIW